MLKKNKKTLLSDCGVTMIRCDQTSCFDGGILGEILLLGIWMSCENVIGFERGSQHYKIGNYWP